MFLKKEKLSLEKSKAKNELNKIEAEPTLRFLNKNFFQKRNKIKSELNRVEVESTR